MNMFKPSQARTVSGYIAAIQDPLRRADIKKLDALIRKAAPLLKRHFALNMIGYGSFRYRSASGRGGDWPVLMLASQKNYLSLYVCATEDGRYVAEAFKAALPGASIGKSCVRFKRLADVDARVLTRLVKRGAAVANKGR